MSLYAIVNGGTAADSTIQSGCVEMPVKHLHQKISAIDASQINSIGSRIAENLLNYLVGTVDDQVSSNFIAAALPLIEPKLVDAFSKSGVFFELGEYFEFSGSDPEGLLAQIIKKSSVTPDNTPIHYWLHLKVDRDLTRENGSDLVFALTATSRNVQVSQTTFPIV